MTNTVFLRLSGPMQSWGTESRLQLRRTDSYPSKSGVLGMILCAMGVRREDAASELSPLAELQMGVRLDRPGTKDWDYHTAGAGIGIRKAEGGVKFTATTKEPETLLSRRQYLYDASFLVALHGEPATVGRVAAALQSPVWPVFLGRKCCVPSEPVLDGEGDFADVRSALSSRNYFTEWPEVGSVTLKAVIEHAPGSKPPADAVLVYDVPRTLANPSHGPRWVVEEEIEAPIAQIEIQSRARIRRSVDYASLQWKEARRNRLALDNGLCVFCKSPAEDVHHVTYERVGAELPEDLRSLCKLCHDACTQLEYGRDLKTHRIDPADPDQRQMILAQVHKLLTGRRLGRRRAIREASRASLFFDDAPGGG
jgi:CRISPR system Cascade subunit CasD